jgi:hypothetical protein
MELHTFYPDGARPFRARAQVFAHSPYKVYVRLLSKRAAKKFQGRRVRWGQYAVVGAVGVGPESGICPHCA